MHTTRNTETIEVITRDQRLKNGRTSQVIYAALAAGPRIDFALSVLDHMRMKKWRSIGVVLVGFKEVEKSVRAVETFPQSW